MNKTVWSHVSLRDRTPAQKIFNLFLAAWSEVALLFIAVASFLGIELGVDVDDSILVWHAQYIFFFGLISIVVLLLFAVYGHRYGDEEAASIARSRVLSTLFVQAILGVFAFAYLLIIAGVLLALPGMGYTVGTLGSYSLFASFMLFFEIRMWFAFAYSAPDDLLFSVFSREFYVVLILLHLAPLLVDIVLKVL